MATCYSGMGDTSKENPETQEIDHDNDSQENFQEDNSIQQLLCKTERLRQNVEDRDNDPRDAIHQLEQKLNQLTLTLHPPPEPIKDMLDKYINTLCNAQNILRKFFVARYSHLEWTRLLTIRGLAHRYSNHLRIDR